MDTLDFTITLDKNSEIEAVDIQEHYGCCVKENFEHFFITESGSRKDHGDINSGMKMCEVFVYFKRCDSEDTDNYMEVFKESIIKSRQMIQSLLSEF